MIHNIPFEDFFKKLDIEAFAKANQPLDEVHKERMRQSYIKHNGYFYPNEVWPEKFGRKFGS